MIIKGTSRSGPSGLAAHLGNAEKNERVQLLETRGTIASDLRGALIELDAYAAGTRCQKPLYHAAISPEPPHRMSPDQRTEAVDALEKKLGFEGHARVVMLHEKEGREHLHVVWTRIDVGQMRSVSDSHNYRKHEEVARDLERRFGHDRVQGAHHERDGVERPDRTPSRSELRQEERTGLKGKDVKADVTAAFRSSDGAESFRGALADNGYVLAQGDRRDFVIVDHAGGIHSLARRIDGVKAAELREFMSSVDLASVPKIGEVRSLLQERGSRDVARDLVDDDVLLRRLREAKEDFDGGDRYGRGDGYVNQSSAAQQDFEKRSERLREQQEQRRLQSQNEERAGDIASHNAPAEDLSGGAELTDGMQERLDRLAAAKLDATKPRDGPGGQSAAPGGGHTRSR